MSTEHKEKRTYKYEYPVTRSSEIVIVLESDTPLNTEEEVMAFYSTQITNDVANNILEEHYASNVCDIFHYIRNNLVNASGPVLHKDLMGDLQFYEGLKETTPDYFIVELGS